MGGQIIPIPRIQSYLGVVENYSPNLFKSHFRVLPDTFHHLVTMLKNELNDEVDSSGRPQYPLDHQILIALWYMATPDSYRFYRRYNSPGVIGCIDCTHVAIYPLKIHDEEHPENIYVNRKNYHSINVQFICDYICD